MASATFDNKNVGTGKTVSVSDIDVTGTDIGNYSLTYQHLDTASITQAAVDHHRLAQHQEVYDGDTSAATPPYGYGHHAYATATGYSGTFDFTSQNVLPAQTTPRSGSYTITNGVPWHGGSRTRSPSPTPDRP